MIYSRAPLRLPLGGGGTDLPSYYREHGGFLIAGAINKYVYMFVHTNFQMRYKMKYSETEDVDSIEDIRHPILRETLKRNWHGLPLEIASVADVPAGTGMGSSGAYTVCLLKALAHARHASTSPGKLAEEACHIELNVLHEPIGKQDQYVAAHGGICAYTFHQDGSVVIEPLELTDDTLSKLRERLLLFYTGKERSASAMLVDQDVRSRAGDTDMLNNLHRTKEIGIESRRLLEKDDLKEFAALMHVHWENKRKRSVDMSNKRVDALYDIARDNGALGGKLIGAGGGGFLLLYSEHPEDTRNVMAEQDAQELPFDFDFVGAYASENL